MRVFSNRPLVAFCSALALAGCHAEAPSRDASTVASPPEVTVPLAASGASASGTPNPATVPREAPQAAPVWCAAPVRSSAEGKLGALAALNQEFLKAHADARKEACDKLESEHLVLRYAFGSLEARYKGKDLLGGPVNILPPEYHPIKDVSHAVLLAALLFQSAPTEDGARATSILSAMDAALAQLDDATSPTTKLIPSARLPAQKRILKTTREAVLAFSQGKLDDKGQRAFFAKVRPDLDENIRSVSGAFLSELHRRVEEARKKVDDPKAWSNLVVVVGSAHQARAREIGVQYFERLLKEPVGEGARNENRLVVSESLWSAADQLGLLATHLVDQTSGELVFGDPLRLQWDVLADSGGVLDAVMPR
jgi:hypothetical protein